VLSSTVISRATDFFADAPLKAAKAQAGLATPWLEHLPFLAQVGLIFFLFEFGQYWMHRAMHNWTPLWLTHAPHHHITQLNALKGYVGNPLELFLISLGVSHCSISARWRSCARPVGNVVAGFAHANVRADPPWFYSYFFTTIRHHSLHHSVGYEETRCNYANSMILIDRVLGTYREAKASWLARTSAACRSRSSSCSFVPVVDAIKARRERRDAVHG
jgi:sterol desaturase/sphingolipid hydroxylase (fatty acid hydroxylase superfamily)